MTVRICSTNIYFNRGVVGGGGGGEAQLQPFQTILIIYTADLDIEILELSAPLQIPIKHINFIARFLTAGPCRNMKY